MVIEAAQKWLKGQNLALVPFFYNNPFLKFTYSEEVTKFCEIFTLLLSYVAPVKSKVKISQNFEVFSEYMNFNGKKIATW